MTTSSTSRRSSSSDAATFSTSAGVDIRCSTVADGDFHRLRVPIDELEPRRRAMVDAPWTMLDQCHGTEVRRVTTPGEHDGASGDVAVTGLDGAVLGCWVGDCAPVVLIGQRRTFAIAHAGWRGLVAGVLDTAAGALGEPLAAIVLGPTIGPCCYEFGLDDLALVATGVGVAIADVSGRTRAVSLALDVPAAVTAFGRRRGIDVMRLGGCTGCSYPWFSHRVRGDRGRHVVAAWRMPVTR